MRYAMRNTLILGVLWILVVITGFLYERHRSKELVRLKHQDQQATAKLGEISAYLAIYDGVKETLARLQERWQNRSRFLMTEDSPGQTFSYLNEILDFPEASITFDFTFLGRVDSTKYSQNSYALTGEGDFRNLYNFIWYIEQGQPFYAISDLEIQGDAGLRPPDEDYDGDRVKFDMTLVGCFSPKSQVTENFYIQDMVAPMPNFNSFRPLIQDVLAPNKSGLFEVEGAILRGLGYQEAFLVDRGGKFHILQEGDRVFHGFLSRVDLDRNRVEFTLDKGGIPEKIVMDVPLEDR